MPASTTATAPAARRPFPLVTGEAEVVGVEDLTPSMRRYTLVHPRFRELPVEEPGEVITLLWPEEGKDLVLPELGWRFPPGVAERQHGRNYTVRSWEPGSDTLAIDFVLHGDHGLASRWAVAAQQGDTLGFAASRMHWVSDIDADWVLLVADETGLPALAAIAETLPAGVTAHVLVEVAGPDEEQPLSSAATLQVQWLHRNGTAAGEADVLAEAVRELERPPGPGRAWGGGEALAVRDVRRHVREAWELPADRCHILGYWKHARTDSWE